MNLKQEKAATLKKRGFYQGKAWREIRIIALQRDHFLCQECLRQKRFTPATEVHHIKPLEEFPWIGLELDNLESLCWTCHEKTKYKPKEKVHGNVRIIRIG